MRRLAWLCLPLAITLPSCAAPSADRGTQPRAVNDVVLMSLKASTLDDWLKWPELTSLLDGGAAALLSTRTIAEPRNDVEVRVAAFSSLYSGTLTRDPARAGALERAVEASGARFLRSGLDAPTSVMPPASTSSATVVAAEPPSLGAADVFLNRLRARPERPTVVVLSLFPPEAKWRDREFLGVIAIGGPSAGRGLLRSASTRRDGLVALSDVAPTVLRLIGVPAPGSMTGRVVTVVRENTPRARLESMERDLLHAADVRSPLLRWFMFAAMFVAVACALGLARERRARVPLVALVVLSAVPLALLLEPVLPGASSTASSAIGVGLVALVLGVGASFALGVRRGLAVVCAITSLAVLADLALGGPLASRSPISYLLTEGARFYGIGNELMGVVVGGLLVAAAVLYEDKAGSRWASLFGPLVLALAVWLMASPSTGAKFGSALTAVPAFGLITARAGGRRITVRLVLALEAGAIALTALVYASDRLKPAAERSHIGGAAGGASATLARKVATALRVAALSFWMAALLAFVGAFVVVARVRREDFRAQRRERPMIDALLKSSAIAIVSAIVFNDAGTIAAALIALPCLALLFDGFSSHSDRVIDLTP